MPARVTATAARPAGQASPPAAARRVHPLNLNSALIASAWYLAITLAVTWPLARGLASDVPADLGDPIFVCWVIGWDAERLLDLIRGDLSGFRRFWNANIFYPEPLTLAYSEHFFAQALQALPIYAASKNLILCYNLLFLSTFVLSGLGVYLLVRDLTGSPLASFIAGALYAFAPYRLLQASHLQTMSAQWMPFVLLGFRRYVETRRLRPLAAGTLALLAQNLSCGYYVIFFGPFVGAYVIYEMADRGLLRDLRVWVAFAVAGALVVAGTLPFLLPYAVVMDRFDYSRLDEIVRFSADVSQYVTRSPEWPWGFLARGLLVAAAIALHGRLMWRVAGRVWESRWRRRLVGAIVIIAAAAASALIVMLLSGGFRTSVGPIRIELTTAAGATVRLLFLALAALVIVSPRIRALARGAPGSPLAFYLWAPILAAWLSLGPRPHAMGERVWGIGLYSWLFEHVPGFDAARVPSRFAMLVTLFLAVLAGLGAQALARRWHGGRAVALGLAAVFLYQTAVTPFTINRTFGGSGTLTTPPDRVMPAVTAPGVYRYIKRLPGDAVLVEFPFGDTAYELRYVYYSSVHWRRILNGYSGIFPPSYIVRLTPLGRAPADPAAAWTALRDSGATHAIVHEGAYVGDRGAAVGAWLRGHGARLIVGFGQDLLFELPPAGR